MLYRCCRVVLLCWLASWSLAAGAIDVRFGLREFDLLGRQWLATHDELVVGMPATAWPPYLYTDGRNDFSGPLNAFASRVASTLGLHLRYRSYPNNAGAQQALLAGEVDMLVGVAPSPIRQLQMQFTSPLMTIPRGILLAGGRGSLTLEEAQGVRWVCVFGTSNCDELLRLGILDLVTVDSRDEAVFMLKEGRADAYLTDLPALTRLQVQVGMDLITADWLGDTSLALAVAPGNAALLRLLEQGMGAISAVERRQILEQGGIVDFGLAEHVKSVLFTRQERAWLARHPVLRFGVSPELPGISEIDGHGRLEPGFVADLLALIEQRTALRLRLVPTGSWAETQARFLAGELDVIPVMTPTIARQQFARFTPSYSSFNRLVVARWGTPELASPRALQGRRVGIVEASVSQALLDRVGAEPVLVKSDAQLLRLLDNQQVDYVLMGMPTLDQALQSGFSGRYQVVLADDELKVPVAMAVQPRDPMLQQILSKALSSIRPEEIIGLESKWVSLTVQTGIKSQTVLRWTAIWGAFFVLCVLLFVGWNRTLRRQIRQRRAAEQRLEEQLLFVQTMLDAMPNLVVLTNDNHEISMTNRAYRQMFLQGEDLSGAYDRLLEHRLPDAIRARVAEEDDRVWESGEEINCTGEIALPDGSVHQLVYNKRLFIGPDGKRLGILTVLTDVTLNRETEARAYQAETRLTQITDSMPGIVYQYYWQGPGRGRFLYASQGLREMVGYEADPVESAATGSDVLGLTGQALHDFITTVEEHARKMQPLDLEVEILREGQPCYLQIRGHFMKQEGLEGIILNGVVQEITSLKRQELELRQARVAAERATQARSRFLATMSHELRTPISGMHGMLELLQMSELNEDQRYMLRNIAASANNLLYLVNDILDFSKIEAGQLHLDIQPYRLQGALCDVIRSYVTKAHAKGLAVSLRWSAAVPEQAELDAIRFGQVLTNLLSNAVKFTEQGQIRIEVGMEGEALRVLVADTGIGIDKEKQARLFTPFEQVESDITRRYGGSGLGLAICRQLLGYMGGTLTLASELGQGTCVSLTVPLSSPEWDAPALQGSEWWLLGEGGEARELMTHLGARVHPLTPQQLRLGVEGYLLADESCLIESLGYDWREHLQNAPLKGIVFSPKEVLRSSLEPERWWRLGSSLLYPDLLLETCQQLMDAHRQHIAVALPPGRLAGRILVADDHPVNRALLARQLALLGVSCELVDDGQQALQAWQRQRFDLLLTDCHMPVMDGYSLTRRLRAAGDESPIIGVTADTSEEASLQMQAAGMNEMLFKPYSLETLRQKLMRWLPVAPSQDEPQLESQEAHWLSLFGGEAVARNMAREYLASNRQDGADMMQALARQDAPALAETAHRIKGAARMVAQQALATEAARLEAAARLTQLDRLAGLSLAVQVLMNSIAREIGQWLDE